MWWVVLEGRARVSAVWGLVLVRRGCEVAYELWWLLRRLLLLLLFLLSLQHGCSRTLLVLLMIRLAVERHGSCLFSCERRDL